MVDRGEERRKPISLFPVTEIDTRRAVAKVLGGPITNLAVYHAHQESVATGDPELWNAIGYLSNMRSKVTSADANFQSQAYASGMMLFHQATKEHARRYTMPMPQVTTPDITTLFLTDIALGVEDPQKFTQGLHRMYGDIDFQIDPGMTEQEQMAQVVKVAADTDIHALLIDPDAAQNRQFLGDLQGAVNRGTAQRFQTFQDTEKGFIGAMEQTHWGGNLRPESIASEVMGAVDAKALVELAQIRQSQSN